MIHQGGVKHHHLQTWDILDGANQKTVKEGVQQLYDRLVGGIEQAATESPGDANLLYQHSFMIEVQLFLHNPAILREIRNIWSKVKEQYSDDSAGETSCALLQQLCELIGLMMDAIGSAGREGVLTMSGESGESLTKLFNIWIQIAWILYERATSEGCLQIDAARFEEMFTLLKRADVFVAERGLSHFKKEARVLLSAESKQSSSVSQSEWEGGEGRQEEEEEERVAKDDRKKEQDGDPASRRRAVSMSMPSLPAARR
eukprot:3932324-Rhodomonas_salina.1